MSAADVQQLLMVKQPYQSKWLVLAVALDVLAVQCRCWMVCVRSELWSGAARYIGLLSFTVSLDLAMPCDGNTSRSPLSLESQFLPPKMSTSICFGSCDMFLGHDRDVGSR